MADEPDDMHAKAPPKAPAHGAGRPAVANPVVERTMFALLSRVAPLFPACRPQPAGWVLPTLLAALTGFALPAAAQVRWDLPSGYSAKNFHTRNLAQFVAEVAHVTSGKFEITVHPDATLFGVPEIKPAVQAGQAQIGEILLSAYTNEWPVFGIDAMPLLATSFDDANRLYKAQRPLLEKKLATQGLVLLYAVPWPPQGLFSKKPVQRLADLQGVKWRAYNPQTLRVAELVRARPVTVQAADLTRAMANGLVEAYMSSASTGLDTKTPDYLRHWLDVQAWLPKNAVIVNKVAFEALSPPLRAALQRAAIAAEARGWAAALEQHTETVAQLHRVGMAVAPPSRQLRNELQEVGDTMLREWLQKAGTEGEQLIETYGRTLK